MRQFLFPFLLVVAFMGNGLAQRDTGLVITDKQWEELTEDVDYTETYRESGDDEKKEQQTNKNFSPSWKQTDALPKYIVYIVLFGLLIYLAIRVLNNFTKPSVIVSETPVAQELEEIEEKIHEVDLDQLLKDAVDKKNYRVALRLHFLIVIKLLSEKEKITWAREKTNWQYYFELKDKLLADQYKDLTRRFEFFWYGERPFSELDYHLTRPLFSDIIKKIGGHE